MAQNQCTTMRNNQSTQSDLFNYYLTMNINNICRICLEKGPKLTPIFDPIKPPHFSILIMACASVHIVEGDGLPPYICQRCIARLNVAFQFKTQCENSDAKLKQCFENLRYLQHAPDLASLIDDKKHDEDNISFHKNEVEPELETTDDLETMTVATCNLQSNGDVQVADIPHFETVHLVTDDSSLAEIHSDKDGFKVGDLKIEFPELKPTEATDCKVDLQLLHVVPKTNSTKTKKSMKHHQCDTCGKVFRTKPSLIHHIRIHTGERPYVCHLCDKRFINGGHLHTHMRTHTGEKNHICAACGKAFATAQQLTKHTIAIHTSERPYGCTYCSKRFASSSNLNTHTRIHTGEKNYHCDQCIKAFSTKGQLYQHLLVHTGEKAFLCEYCDKRFTQKAHLTRHLKMHKN